MTRFVGRVTRGVGVGVLFGAVGLAGPSGVAGATSVARVQPQVGMQGGARAAKVPKDFRATSITWISPERGWVLGSVPCPSPASGGSSPGCAYVIGTINAGKTWTSTGAINTHVSQAGQSGKPGVSEIRFANSKVGWAYGPDLYRTANGGRSWTKVALPGTGKQVVTLAANGGSVYAATSPCANGSGAGDCNQKGYTFWRAAKLTGAWIRIPLKSGLPAGMFDNGADIAVYGKTVYALRSATNNFGTAFADKIYASTDGIHFAARPDPCAAGLALTQAVPTSATDVAILCANGVGNGQTNKAVYRSTNTGKKDTSAGVPPSAGDYPQLAASPSGNLAVSASFAASYIFINDTGKKTWDPVVSETDGGLGWNDIVYVSDREAWIVHEPAQATCSCALGQVFVTRDGGRHWTQAGL